ncbi:hypothetical protein ScalyP_jg2938 [Parmales sp. scaly parma]|nr:hypothetical protein ScalyP_jg2938 [Parmales sp. scaly parma]
MAISTKVLIVGGGPTGLFLSKALSCFGVDNMVVTKSVDVNNNNDTTQHTHRGGAHFVNTRTVEILNAFYPHQPLVTPQPQAPSSCLSSKPSPCPPLDHWSHFTYGHTALNVGSQFARVNQFTPSLLEKLNKWSEFIPVHLGIERLVGWMGAGNDGNRVLYDLSLSSFIETASPDGTSLGIEAQFTTTATNSPALTVKAKYLIGCDGSHSKVREILKIPMNGTTHESTDAQHLVNINFSTTERINDLFFHTNRKTNDIASMLYFVYNQNVVGAFVALDLARGEWVCQVPFFPPLQEFSDFSAEHCQKIVAKGLGVTDDLQDDVRINSVSKWVMTNSVASTYSSESKRVFLAGDAAHLFPPSGGFGMNCGIQDAHNLAWKLAVSENFVNNSNEQLLESYELERRAVACEYAALSVRNYERTLDISKTIGLNAEYPKTLVNLSASSSLPLSLKQKSFQFLVDAAMAPLGALDSSKALARASAIPLNLVKKRFSKILESQGNLGLPLLFPKYELGAAYTHEAPFHHYNESSTTSDTDDYLPFLKVGHRIPHCFLSGVHSFSTVGLSARLSLLREENECFFVLLVVDEDERDEDWVEYCERLKSEFGLNVTLVNVKNESEVFNKATNGKGSVAAVLLRPDDYVSQIFYTDDDDDVKAKAHPF